jgi:hypothetical protein
MRDHLYRKRPYAYIALIRSMNQYMIERQVIWINTIIILLFLLLDLPPAADAIAPRTLSERHKLRTGIWGAFILLIVVGGGRGALTIVPLPSYFPARSVASRSAGCCRATCAVPQSNDETRKPYVITVVLCSYHNCLLLFAEVTIENNWDDWEIICMENDHMHT